MLLELIEELKMAVKFDEAITELKQLELNCEMEPEGGEVCDEDSDDPCGPCAANRILNEL